jgi:hypothetical protein
LFLSRREQELGIYMRVIPIERKEKWEAMVSKGMERARGSEEAMGRK